MKLLILSILLSAPAFATGNAPGNLQTNANVGRCFIHWTDTNSSPNEDGTSMQMSVNDNLNFSWIGRVGQNVVNHTQLGLTSGVTYYFRVKAIFIPGPSYSAYSNEASCVPL